MNRLLLIILLILLLPSLTTLAIIVEDTETTTFPVKFKARSVSSHTFKRKGVRFLKKLISKQADELKLTKIIHYKKVYASKIEIKVRYLRLGKVLVQQNFLLTKYNKKLKIKTIYYKGFSDYKMQLDGVIQTHENNPDTIINSNTSVNSNTNKNSNVNRNKNSNRNKNKNGKSK
jgi:hypothetical protein